ncbi:MAG: hypothetical protein M3124_00125 [Actinomycetota bacterium]|nr:hypothetical protein [Actinomycetota bacterium]
MNTTTSESTDKSRSRPWWIAALVVAVVVGVIAAAVAMTAEDDPPTGTDPGPSASVGDPKVKQADWKIGVKRAGKPGKLSKRQRKMFIKQRKALRSVTRDVYDTMFLSPEKLGGTMRKVFTPKARVALKRSGAGLPKRAKDIRIRRRLARIAIDASGSRRATMKVRVVATGTAKGKKFTLEHNSALYLSRDGGRWEAFAFTVDQGPYKKPARPKDKNQKNKKEPGKDQGKGGNEKRSDSKKKKRKGDRS